MISIKMKIEKERDLIQIVHTKIKIILSLVKLLTFHNFQFDNLDELP